MFSTKRADAFSEGPLPTQIATVFGSRLPLRNMTATSNSICHNSSLAVHPFGGSMRNDEFDSEVSTWAHSLRCLRLCQQCVFSTKRPKLLAKAHMPMQIATVFRSRLPLRNTTATSNSICHNSSLVVHPFGGSTFRNDEFDSLALKMSTPVFAGISGVLRSHF
ncbi:hypothetical protein CDAR_286591 [Caerostris darwini]|uniref:Uncharacterized protein n=1 Tax=Caerostris darwini TaxID=1538125 RepID=A0AAV4UU85_9ARAC|nr:hypothetical protein CDAR_286591 [Caerostris darwini]